MPSRNVGDQLPNDAATSHPRTTVTTTIPMRKTKNSQGKTLPQMIHTSVPVQATKAYGETELYSSHS
jgi:hypothetical protein